MKGTADMAELKDLGGGYFQVVIRLRETCSVCGKYFRPSRNELIDDDSMWSINRLARQLGWVTKERKYHNQWVCLDCAATLPKTPQTFICDHCDKERLLEDELQRTHDGEMYCTTCYETMTAKAWDELFYELNESDYLTGHEWD
jgi:hypothetical protein